MRIGYGTRVGPGFAYVSTRVGGHRRKVPLYQRSWWTTPIFLHRKRRKQIRAIKAQQEAARTQVVGRYYIHDGCSIHHTSEETAEMHAMQMMRG